VGDIPQGGSPFDGTSPFGDIFGDIFDSFFGGGGRRGRSSTAPRRGSDLEMELECTLEEAFSGAVREVSIPRWEGCKRCGGTGAEPGTSPEACPAWGGRGQVEHVQRTPFGQFSSVTPCARCAGRGKIISSPCKSCNGNGMLRQSHRLDVRIPPGADTGLRLRITGEGEAGVNGGPPGDLYLLMRVREHPRSNATGTGCTPVSVCFPRPPWGVKFPSRLLMGKNCSTFRRGVSPERPSGFAERGCRGFAAKDEVILSFTSRWRCPGI
jgi:molecular chaperone DnaJ